METQTQDPIQVEWTTSDPQFASATEVASILGSFRVNELPDSLTPFMAAAGAELASISGIGWRFGTDDPPVALLRLIARVAISLPNASGPHTQRLAEQLDRLHVEGR